MKVIFKVKIVLLTGKMCEAMTKSSKFSKRCLMPIALDQEDTVSKFCLNHASINRNLVKRYHIFADAARDIIDMECNRHGVGINNNLVLYSKRHIPSQCFLTEQELIRLRINCQSAFEMRIVYKKRIVNGYNKVKFDGHDKEINWMQEIWKLCEMQLKTKKFFSQDHITHIERFNLVKMELEERVKLLSSKKEKLLYEKQLLIFSQGGKCTQCDDIEGYCRCWNEFKENVSQYIAQPITWGD